MATTENSSWNNVLGPVYRESGLRNHGITEIEGLIGLHTTDDVVVYPHAQFDVLPDQTLHPRGEVLDLWNTLIRPAIDEGVVDEWTATGLLLQSTVGSPSAAEMIASGQLTVEKVASGIARSLSRYRQ